MTELLLHPTTAHQLKSLLQSQPHAILIFGGAGAGKQAVAEKFVTQVLGVKSLANNQHFLFVSPQTSSIGIESVRVIKDFLSRKSTGSASLRRIILISEAHTMTTEAQNSLLKTLEEPPADTMIILTATDPTALRSTIRSRAQQLLVLPVSQQSAETYFTIAGFGQPDIQAAYYMSGGRVGLLKALLEEAADHELVSSIAEAKELIKMTAYERLVRVDALSKDKERLGPLLQGLERVVISGLRQAADKNNKAVVKKFYGLSLYLQQAQEALAKSGNAKIVLTELFINM